ncbi:O-methyltransferase [Trueperella bialowiezensis]|uniref:O-methyltransferase MSMEG_5073 n=1 Tax=Trueperella bialowiezensis TaxID=312285 RepID=A0A448PG59_9ACTO|nr:O-methyltransferase [Trueperella bialowiezensis]VEI13939.1 Putative O-methyltransferase MSMEG_5073 [Trueperella bialowiezensis]
MALDKAQSWTYAEQIVADLPLARQARSQALELGIDPLSPATGHFLRALASIDGVKHIAEVGTGTGLSGFYLLSGSSESVLTSIDVDSEAQNYARSMFNTAGIRPSRFRLINGRSADLLPRLANNAYDLVLIDADPAEAAGDVSEALRMLRPGGTLVLAHALNSDRVADPARRDEATVTLRNLGRELIEAEDVVSSLIPLGDGLLISVKL